MAQHRKQKRDTKKVSVSGVNISSFAKIEHESWSTGGLYKARDNKTDKEIGSLYYVIRLDDPYLLTNLAINVDPDYQDQNVGTALLEKLHIDYPEHFVSVVHEHLPPGYYDHQKKIQPDFATTMVQDGAREIKE